MREPDSLLPCGLNRMQQIKITLWHHHEMRDWSVEIDGRRHEHVTSELVEALVECQLIVAERSLTDQQCRDPGMGLKQ
jgi:hypothetical protein